MATNQKQLPPPDSGGSDAMIFPEHLGELIAKDGGYPYVFIQNNEDDSQFFLPVPSDLSLGDGADYGSLDRSDFRSAEEFKKGGAGAVSEADQLALGLRVAANLPGLDKLAGETLLRNRVAINPMTEMTFTGMNMRTLSLGFKMVPRNEQEAELIGKIVHKFRELMYAKKTGGENSTGYTVRYPALFRIKFMAGENESRFFPIFYDAYLKDFSTNFFAQQGAFMRVGDDFMAPQIDITLGFSESKMLTRDNLYNDDGTVKFNTGEITTNGPINKGDIKKENKETKSP